MTEFGGPIKVDGPVSASQATKEGECVVLGEGAKIPPGFYDSITGGYFEALDPADLPQDFVNGDIILALLDVRPNSNSYPESWTDPPNSGASWLKGTRNACVIWGRIDGNAYVYGSPVYSKAIEDSEGAIVCMLEMSLTRMTVAGNWNSESSRELMNFEVSFFNGAGVSTSPLSITTNQMGDYVSDLYRMRAPSQ